MKTTTKLLKKKLSVNIINKRLLGLDNKFSTSAVLFSSKNLEKSKMENLLDKDFLIKKREEGLQVVKYEPNPEIDSLLTNDSEISESFPWLVNKEGNNIDYNSEINLFKGVELVSRYLEKRYNFENVNNVRLTEILKPIYDKKDNEGITVIELYKHISTLFNNNEFKQEMLQSIQQGGKMDDKLIDTIESSKPLGAFGETTLNEIITNISNFKWDLFINSAKITIHAVPVAFNAVGYGLIMRTYMKNVYNRPFPATLNNEQLKLHHKIRSRNLAVFSFLGAPLILICLRKTSMGLKDMTSIEILPNNSNNNLSTNIINKGGIFLMLSNLNNQIPSWLKWILRLIIISIILLNLIGFNSLIDVLSNILHIKLFGYLSCSLFILYQIFNLYLLHRFIYKNIIISPVLPDFIIKWLKELETISSNIESSRYFKNSCYTQIFIYLLVIFLISFIL